MEKDNEIQMTNLTYNNQGKKMGDDDGPAYVTYSKTGYNHATIDVILSEIALNTLRRTDKKNLNAYLFLGIDVYDENGCGTNCVDAGLAFTGENGAWHMFYNVLKPSRQQIKWYESDTLLDASHDYRLILNSSEFDGRAKLQILDITNDLTVADEIEFDITGSQKDGSNTAMLQNYALDYPENICCDRQGNSSGEWDEITLYNTDQNVFMRNIKIANATLNHQPWTEEINSHMAMWPDNSISKIDYPVVIIRSAAAYSELLLDLEMNRMRLE